MRKVTQPTIICIKSDLYLSFQFFICFAFLICCSGNLLPQRQKRGVREPCAESLKTVKVVTSCPKDKDSWARRAKLKNCGDVPRNCSVTDFVYHCILDEFGENLLELCAATTEIIARFCSEFSSGGMFIQEHAEKPCKRCPFAYNSSLSYMYAECYELPELPESTITTIYIENTTKGQTQTKHVPHSNSTLMPGYEKTKEVNLRSNVMYIYITLGISAPIISILIVLSVLSTSKKRSASKKKMRKKQSNIKDNQGDVYSDSTSPLVNFVNSNEKRSSIPRRREEITILLNSNSKFDMNN